MCSSDLRPEGSISVAKLDGHLPRRALVAQAVRDTIFIHVGVACRGRPRNLPGEAAIAGAEQDSVAAGQVKVPIDVDVDQFVIDTRFFLGALQGLSDDAAERLVLPFPSQEVDPYRGLTPHLEVASARARALHARWHQCAASLPKLLGSRTGIFPSDKNLPNHAHGCDPPRSL